MATFVFRAVDLAGVPARGEVDADSKQAVTDQLKSRGLIVLDINSKKGSKEISLEFMERVKARDLMIMTRQLSTMVSSGVTILRALYVLEEQTESKRLKRALVQIRKDVEAGLPLSDSLARHPKIFKPLYISMVRAGESGGLLESALLRTADQLEKEDALRRQVRAAMVYPAVVVSFAIGVPVLQAIEVTGKTAGNKVVEDAMDSVHDSVKRGGTIAAPLKDVNVFPSMVVHMIGVGEETGALDTMLTKIADFYEEEVSAAIKALTSILEPVMIILIGGIAGFIVISMYLPLFKVYDQIK